MDNITPDGKWKENEEYYYNGQWRKHVKDMSVGRALESWRKLREREPHLLRHFRVMSQPASNCDGIIMSWIIKSQSRQYGMSVWQRDCLGAAFTDENVKAMNMAHQIQATIAPGMTSALQLTDTDVSHQASFGINEGPSMSNYILGFSS